MADYQLSEKNGNATLIVSADNMRSLNKWIKQIGLKKNEWITEYVGEKDDGEYDCGFSGF